MTITALVMNIKNYNRQKQTEIQTYISQKSSIIAKRFPVWYCLIIEHVQTMHWSRSCGDAINLKKKCLFVAKITTHCYFHLFITIYVQDNSDTAIC